MDRCVPSQLGGRFSVDPSGQVNKSRPVDIVGSDAMKRIREKSPDVVILADGHRGMVLGEATGG